MSTWPATLLPWTSTLTPPGILQIDITNVSKEALEISPGLLFLPSPEMRQQEKCMENGYLREAAPGVKAGNFLFVKEGILTTAKKQKDV